MPDIYNTASQKRSQARLSTYNRFKLCKSLNASFRTHEISLAFNSLKKEKTDIKKKRKKDRKEARGKEIKPSGIDCAYTYTYNM